MYRDTKFTAGWLFIQSLPNGPWREATEREMIAWLVERVQQLEEQARAAAALVPAE